MWCPSSLFVRFFLSSAPPMAVVLIGGGPYADPVAAKSPPCPVGYFRNSTSVPARCSPCSGCSINHIVRRPCGRQDDTVCGPFYEFEFQRQSNGTLIGEPRYFSKVGYRLTHNGYAPSDDGLVTSSTSSSSPEEAITVRCGQPQWRMLCYGLVAALVVVVSVALTVFALYAYCRSSVKTIRLDDTHGVRGRAGVDDSSETSTIIVGRDVRHLEEQLIHNQRRKAFLRWLFGSSVTADRLFSSNDYLDERHRRRFIRMLDGSSGVGQAAGGGRDALPLEPYPGMTLTGRTDRRHPTLQSPNSNDDDDRDEETNLDGVDVVQTEEQSTVTVGERSLLLSEEESNLET